MKKKIRILFVEDMLNDAEILSNLISLSQIDFEKQIVETRKDYIEAIKSFVPDLIICDYSLPQFDGMSALTIRNELIPSTPFILVTGTLSEEIAVECIKAGADDYLLKQNLSRLGEAIKSSLRKMEILSQKEKAEENLRNSEARFKHVAEHLGEWVWEVDASGLYTYVSPVSISLLGYSPEEIVGKKHFYDFFAPDIRERMKEMAFQVFSRQEIFRNFENPNIHKDGRIIYLLTSGAPILDREGKLMGYRGADKDITKQKAYEESLQKNEARLRSYFNISGAGIAITAPSGRWMEVNDYLCHMLGYTREEIFTTTWADLTHPEDLELDLNHFNKVMAGQSDGYNIDKRFIKSTNEHIWTNLSVRCVRNSDGAVEYFVALLFDINERKRVEKELIEARDKAEESDRLKTAFLHNVSHEIRTPLNAIIGFSSLLAETGLDETSRNSYIDTINNSSDQLLSIINDIIEVSNIDAGIVKFKIANVIVKETLNNIFNQFVLKSQNKGIRLSLILPPPQSEREAIYTDRTKLQQVLSNLLSNAIKFTSSGEVRFGYTQESGFLKFFVSDTGIGIPENLREKIFDRFYQVQHLDDRPFEGTGLGLSISKAYVEKLGGRIWVESETGSGTVFYFTLPVKYSPSRDISPVPEEMSLNLTSGKKILIAEDNYNNFRLMEMFLKDPMLKLLHASNGFEAVNFIKSDPEISLVLMDLKMPVMDGYMATDEILKLRPGLPVIAQTAFVSEVDKALKCGCKDVITKPFRKTDLLKVLVKYL